MNVLKAKNPKQLDLCLRLLYAEQVPFSLIVTETDKKKIVYEIKVAITDPQALAVLREKYRILIT